MPQISAQTTQDSWVISNTVLLHPLLVYRTDHDLSINCYRVKLKLCSESVGMSNTYLVQGRQLSFPPGE